MKTKKLDFSEMKNALSRSEMKQIMAGSGPNGCCVTFVQNTGTGSTATVCGYGSLASAQNAATQLAISTGAPASYCCASC